MPGDLRSNLLTLFLVVAGLTDSSSEDAVRGCLELAERGDVCTIEEESKNEIGISLAETSGESALVDL